jgi:alpha-beta hydrolase superfamily lysophospholipase
MFIQNRKHQKISVIVDIAENSKGLAFVMHGLGGFKEQPHIKALSEAFVTCGITAVRFDTTNTFGESDGNYEDATTTNYYEDLCDVIEWASKQIWYREPFYLAGHSLGGICVALYAEQFPSKIAGLVPVSSVVSGKLSIELDKDGKEEWKRTGWRERPSVSKPGTVKRLKWSHIEDRLKYDLIPEAPLLKMPVLLIVGENDESTPLNHQQILFSAFKTDKELHIIKDAPHTFRSKEHIDEIRQILIRWLANHKA